MKRNKQVRLSQNEVKAFYYNKLQGLLGNGKHVVVSLRRVKPFDFYHNATALSSIYFQWSLSDLEERIEIAERQLRDRQEGKQ